MAIKNLLRTLVLASTIGMAAVAAAQDFPNKPIHLIAGFPPGGSVDAVARIIAEGMSQNLGQPVVVENKIGASGVVAANYVATSKPDGYTLLLVPGGHALYSATLKSVPFDTVKSFDWVAKIYTVPFFMTVSSNSPYRSLSEIVEKAKGNPGGIKFGSVGPGSPHHLGMELLGIATGTKYNHVAYRGEGPVMAAFQGGEIDFAMFTSASLLGGVQSGTLRPLAVTTKVRSSRLPDVPTVEELLRISTTISVAGFRSRLRLALRRQ